MADKGSNIVISICVIFFLCVVYCMAHMGIRQKLTEYSSMIHLSPSNADEDAEFPSKSLNR